MAAAPPETSLLSIDQIADRLGIHAKTVRRYVRDGRLKATRIGKEYRITPEDFAAFTGQTTDAVVRDGVRRQRHTDVSSVVQIDAIPPAEAIRVMTIIGGAIKGRNNETDSPLRVDTVYDEVRARLKVIISGSLPTTIILQQLINETVS